MPLQVSQTTNNPMRPYSGDDLLRDPFLKKGIVRPVLRWLRAWRDWWGILAAHLLLAHLQTGKGWDERKQYTSKEWMLLPSSYGYGTCTFFPECTSWDLPASSPWDVTGAEQSQSSPSANRNHCMQRIRHSLLFHYVCNAMSMLLLIIQKLKMMLETEKQNTLKRSHHSHCFHIHVSTSSLLRLFYGKWIRWSTVWTHLKVNSS